MKTNSAQIIVENILLHISLEDKQVLEIGCGTGRISSLLVDKVKKLVAIDPDMKDICEARNSISRGVFHVGSGESLEFLDSCFDVVIFTLSLHHQNSRLALMEAGKVLKVGGEILVIEPTAEGEIQKILSLFHNEERAKKEAQNAIRKSDLKLKQEEIFNAEWVFEDKGDLYQTLFKYYNVPFNTNTAHQISALVGMKQNSSPIVLQDNMILQSLIKVV